MSNKDFYITTAIDYANGTPHIGHAYEKVLTDVITRFQKMTGKATYFVTGLDEHGQKVQQSAHKQGISPQELCDNMAIIFQDMCTKLNISHNYFIRTTDNQHKNTVHTLLQKLFDEGLIYKAQYKGFYSARAEQFLQEKDRVNGQWPEIFGEVIEITESNYFFQLSQYQSWLIEYIHQNPDFIIPQYRAKQVLEFLKEPINDLCISRPKSRLSWGIELPFDSEFVTYVWFDALINYISAIGFGTPVFDQYWPADYHVIGKDILVPAHGVYWPIMLKALNIQPPKSLLVHGWWLSSGNKMSKSLGNTLDPFAIIDQFGADPFRYFLMREMTIGQDSNFSYELMLARYNNELANDLGNLISRLLNMTEKYCSNTVPVIEITEEPENNLISLWNQTYPLIVQEYQQLNFSTGLDKLFEFIRSINRYAEIRSPWKLAKSLEQKDQAIMRSSLAFMAESIRLSTILLYPIMPETASKIQKLLGLNPITVLGNSLDFSQTLQHSTLGTKTILFPKIELPA